MAAGILRRGILLRGILHSRGMGDLHRYVFDGDVVFGGLFLVGRWLRGQMSWKRRKEEMPGITSRMLIDGFRRCNTKHNQRKVVTEDAWVQCEFPLSCFHFSHSPFIPFNHEFENPFCHPPFHPILGFHLIQFENPR